MSRSQSRGWLPKLQNPRRNQYKPLNNYGFVWLCKRFDFVNPNYNDFFCSCQGFERKYLWIKKGNNGLSIIHCDKKYERETSSSQSNESRNG